MTMADLERSLELPYPAEQVWELVTDLSRTPEWRTTVAAVEPPAALEPGATFSASTRVLGRTWKWSLVVGEVDPPATFSYAVEEGFTDIAVTYRLVTTPTGCRFTLRARSRPRNLLERAIEPLAARALRRQTEQHLDNLRRLLDRELRPAGAFPVGHDDERELYLDWLAFLRGAVLRNVDGLTDEQARWRPDGKLLPLIGIVNHLAHVEWRWIDGDILGRPVHRDEAEFDPGSELTLEAAVTAYRERAAGTDAVLGSLPLDTPCRNYAGADLRFVAIHLINETARHAGHADAVRELLDGTTGE